MRRLIAILHDITQNEGRQNLTTIGRKQIIGYWRRKETETNSTRREKYNILVKYFELENPNVTVPKPDPKKCEKSEQITDVINGASHFCNCSIYTQDT